MVQKKALPIHRENTDTRSRYQGSFWKYSDLRNGTHIQNGLRETLQTFFSTIVDYCKSRF